MDQKLIFQIGLTLIPKIGPVIAKNLITHCGSAKAVFSADKKTLLAVPGVGPALVNNILKQNVLNRAETEVKKINNSGIKAHFFLDSDYPARLKHYNDCPLIIYCKGDINLNHNRVISIVGTRDPSPRGISFCRSLVNDLERLGVIVVSGMAYGIDITAHKACVEAGIPTVGVMGHGLGTIYPAMHKPVARQMMANGGLISEFLFDTPPDKVNFPMRNRIISGMCDALVVVETGRKGGSMISAELANAYNKDVFAVPGRLNDSKSAGCNHLIKTHKAALIESGKDIAYVMGWDEKMFLTPNSRQQALFKVLDKDELEVVNVLKATEKLEIDQLSQKLGMKSGSLSSVLLALEFKGIVKALPGKRYMLV